MKIYEHVRSNERPQEIEITASAVYISSDIVPYEESINGRTISGYEYKCTVYSKDEYLIHQNEKISSLEEELKAAKILLGVD